MENIKTLTDLIIERKNEKEKGIIFVLNDKDEKKVTYSELYDKASHLLYILQQNGFKKGDLVIFQIDNNELFIYSFWACTLGGMIPVPLTTGETNENNSRLLKIWSILDSPKMITYNESFKNIKEYALRENEIEKLKEMSNNHVEVNKDTIEKENEVVVGKPKKTNEEDLAFIQFSSGSTGDPKGVMITHKNVLINLTAVKDWSHLTSEDVSLSWLPLTHDMGLIGDHIKNVIINIMQVNMPTSLFIKNPTLWIDKASEHKATILYSPNFGYKHFCDKFDENIARNWDLSSIKIIYNGAEPISLSGTNKFIDILKQYGLKSNAMAPAYGLAESTIAVSFPFPGDEVMFNTVKRKHLGIGDKIEETNDSEKYSATFMDVGHAIFNCKIRITDENNKDIGEKRIGYIQISGGNVTKGYYHNKKATNEAFTDDGWFNTGDLGFLKNERLTITGRAKDIIFVSGQNFYAPDIERTVDEVIKEEELKSVAIGSLNRLSGCDELILFITFRGENKDFYKIVSKIKREVGEKLKIDVASVIPIKEIPKTSSGKIQHFKLKTAYENGFFSSLDNEIKGKLNEIESKKVISLPKTETEKKLTLIYSSVLDKKNIGIDDNFFYIGGNSLIITQLLSRINEEFEIELSQNILFENQTIKDVAKYIDNSNNSDRHKDSEVIKRIVLSENKYELSYSQKSLWFMNAVDKNSAQYNLHTTLELIGNVDIQALEKSLNEVVKNNNSLKTEFFEEDGLPYSRINQNCRIPFTFDDLSKNSEIEKTNIIKTIEISEAKKPFNLENAPLIRAHVLNIEENSFLLILAVHHIVFDGWSFKILMNDLNLAYTGIVEGKALDDRLKEIEYTDYVTWQNQAIRSDKFNKEIAYFKENLGKDTPTLDFPYDLKRRETESFQGKTKRCYVDNNILFGLKEVAKNQNVTLYMLLLSAFSLLIYRYTAQKDLLIGSPIAGRNKKETENVIGLFTNNLVIRSTILNKQNFFDFLADIKKTCLLAFKNQDVPFEKIVEELNLKRDMSKNPLFQVFFALQNTPQVTERIGDIKVKRIDFDAETSRFDLSLDVTEVLSGLTLDFEYSRDLFYDDTIDNLAEHYIAILNLIAKCKDFNISQLDLQTAKEKDIYKNINFKTDYDLNKRYSEIFEQNVELYRNNVAVKDTCETLTYEILNEKANQLANYLLNLGVTNEDTIGVYLSRTSKMLIALIAINKIGASYLPMDPIYPKERLIYMLEDADVKTIISESNLYKSLKESADHFVLLDNDNEKIAALPSQKPILKYKTSRNDLAYLIYTSGSTGKPKGVQIEQHSLTNFLLSMKDSLKMNETDKLLAVTTLSFDIAGLEMYLPLICGASIVIATHEDVVDGESLIKLINKNDISVMQATPATYRLMLESGFKGKSNLKILCGGEGFEKELADKLLTNCKNFYNVYGPTETAIWSTIDEVTKDQKSLSIGKPIANTSVYVVDELNNRVPLGVPGELLIGGEGVSRGYNNLDKLTAERFIDNKFLNKDNNHFDSKLYKTGDLVKLLSDGKLKYLNRLDNQVKIRGFRIELSEIEAQIDTHNEVNQSVVVDKEVKEGEKFLVAYIKLNSTITTEDEIRKQIREQLKNTLPSYMIPSYFVFMDEFPMTSNKKVDKKALPMPILTKRTENQTDKSFVESRKIKSMLINIWKEVLDLNEIDEDANFFDLGGHSLLITKVKYEIKEKLHFDISITDLFKYSTINSLEKFISGGCNDWNHGETQKEIAVTNVDSLDDDIAIIGMSGKFPGADNVEDFFKNLCEGKNCISSFSDEELINNGVPNGTLKKNNYVKAWGVISNPYEFDAQFFGFNPTEAKTIDPQQRLFLEESYKVFENAGYNPFALSNNSCGVFASVGMNNYKESLLKNSDSNTLARSYQIMTGNEKDFIATRTAYKLGLKGPSMTVQTACSSSMVAVSLACDSIKKGECDMAIAGGVSVKLPQERGYLYEEGMILSPDGYCRAFDSKAKGTVGGNGVGVVLLKRLSEAKIYHDNIIAVVKAVGVNNDGNEKVGYTAPSVNGETNAIKIALAKSEVNPSSIKYIETHGTGTILGDPIEIEALNTAYKGVKNNSCAIGAVKPNIGHLDSASGIAGFIKTAMILKNKVIPPNINYTTPNPKIDFNNSPFYVNKELCKLEPSKNSDKKIYAAVSSFGIGGTNVHAILEEPPEGNSQILSKDNYLLTFSAKSKSALKELLEEYNQFFKNHLDINMSNLEFTLQTSRSNYRYRYCKIVRNIEEMVKALDSEEIEVMFSDSSEEKQMITNTSGLSKDELANKWLKGVIIDFEDFFKCEKVVRLVLPNYPFKKQEYKAETDVKIFDSQVVISENLKNSKNQNMDEWFYTPVFSEYQNTVEDIIKNNCKVIILDNGIEKSKPIINEFKAKCDKVTVAKAGNDYKKISDCNFVFNQKLVNDYELLLKETLNDDDNSCIVVDLLGIYDSDTQEMSNSLSKSLYLSLINFSKAVGNLNVKKKFYLFSITNNMQNMFCDKNSYPEKSISMGAIKVIPLEYKNIVCKAIDINSNSILENSENIALLAEFCLSGSKEVNESTSSEFSIRFNKLFIKEYKQTSLQKHGKDSIELKENGTYIVFGGLGGVGLMLTECLSKKVNSHLVLVSNEKFPERSQFNEYLITHANDDNLANKLNQLIDIEKTGSNVLVLQGDITKIDDLKTIREQVINRFKRIDGIITAAGGAAGGMIQLKTEEIIEKAIASKFEGTENIYSVFRDCSPEFMIFCSSINSITGGFGQADYSAANAFLNFFASSHDGEKTKVISIDWDRFPGIGIASNMIKKDKIINSIIGREIFKSNKKVIFQNIISPEKDWILSEHKVMDVPTIAGTTYLEMARAGFKCIENTSIVEIKDIVFLTPMAVKFGSSRKVYTIFNKKDGFYEFKVVSSRNPDEFVEHAEGKILVCDINENRKVDIEKLLKDKGLETIFSYGNQEMSQKFISFGDRWLSLKKFVKNDSFGIAEISMKEKYMSDIEANIKLHPSVLDVATGSLRLLTADNYLPFSYKSLKLYDTLPNQVYSYLKFKPQDDENYNNDQMLTCDIEILSKNGDVIVEIEGFTMKKITDTNNLSVNKNNSSNKYTYLSNISNDDVLDNGLTPKEGKQCFERILNSCRKPNIIVSVKDLNKAIKEANYVDNKKTVSSLQSEILNKQPRPLIDTQYVEPHNNTEKKLAKIWEDVLGIDKIGIYDEFFSLGGDSLLLIQLHNKLSESFSDDIAIVDLYKYNTVQLLAKKLMKVTEVEQIPKFMEVNERVEKQKELMKKRNIAMKKRQGGQR